MGVLAMLELDGDTADLMAASVRGPGKPGPWQTALTAVNQFRILPPGGQARPSPLELGGALRALGQPLRGLQLPLTSSHGRTTGTANGNPGGTR